MGRARSKARGSRSNGKHQPRSLTTTSALRTSYVRSEITDLHLPDLAFNVITVFRQFGKSGKYAPCCNSRARPPLRGRAHPAAQVPVAGCFARGHLEAMPEPPGLFANWESPGEGVQGVQQTQDPAPQRRRGRGSGQCRSDPRAALGQHCGVPGSARQHRVFHPALLLGSGDLVLVTNSICCQVLRSSVCERALLPISQV